MNRRLAVPLAAIALLAASLAPADADAPTGAERLCGGGSDAVLKKGQWTWFARPEGLGRVIAHAEASNRAALFVTDGKTVMRSTDEGCSWQAVYEAAMPTGEGTPVDGLVPRISRLTTVPETMTVLMVVDGVAQAAGSQVLRSEELGAEGSWEPVEGLPAVTGVREIVPAPDSGQHLYLITGVADAVGDNEPAGASGLLYRSDDDGRTWTSLGANGEVVSLAVEPDTDATYLWVVRGNGSVLISQNAGSNFVDITANLPANEDEAAPADHWRDVAVFRFSTVAHTVVLSSAPTREADVTRVVYSQNQGSSWQDLSVNSLGPAGGLVFGNGPGALYHANGSRSTAWRGPGLSEFSVSENRWRGADDLNLVSLFDARRVHEPRESAPAYHSIYLRAHPPGADGQDVLARFEPPAPDPEDLPLGGRPDCGNPNATPKERKAVRFEPERLSVQLTPGEPARVPIAAALAPDPAPVDVTFLIDSSTSMDPAVEGVYCSVERLVRELPERNLDAHFGLAAYNDFMSTSYQRLVNLAPPKVSGPAMSEALKLLNTLRGEDEPLRTALYQLATGAGLNEPNAQSHDDPLNNTDNGLSGDRIVPPGQQIDWREDGKSLRTVFVITDEPYENGTEGEPALDDVLAQLTARNIRVIGLPVVPEGAAPTHPDHGTARQAILRLQIDAIARGTKALAPKGGVDCDGGGTPDVPEGSPIVCPIDERGIRKEIDDTLVSVLASLVGPDRKAVRLVPRRTDGLSASVEGEPVELNMRQPNDLESTAVLGCTPDQQGERFDISFDVVAGDNRVLDTIEGVARCGAIAAAAPVVKPPRAAEPKPDPAPPAEPAPAPAPQTPPAPQPVAAPAVAQAPQPAVAAAPPPPPPAPAPVNGVPATSSAPANAAVTQPGVTMQEERKPQINLAKVDAADGEHAMVSAQPSAFRAPVPMEALVTLGVGLSGLLVYVGVSAAPRRRRKNELRPAKVEIRR